MRFHFWKKESNLETLERQLKAIDKQIADVKADLEALRGGSIDVDPVLQKFLEERFGFDYGFEKEKLARVIKQKGAQLMELEGEKKKLEPQIREEAFKKEIERRKVIFVGKDVEGSEGSVAKIRCSDCGHKFSIDLRNHGSFNNVWGCSTNEALTQIYMLGLHRVWPLNCEKCRRELNVYVNRGQL
jgi:hypothetical protein